MKWSTLLEQIRHDFSAPEPPPEDRFWGRFRERVRAIPRITPVREDGASSNGPRRARPVWLRVGRVLAPALAAVAIALLLRVHQAPAPETDRRQFSARAGKTATLSTVEDIDVLMDYDSVFIVEDPKSRGTLVWILGANSATPGG
ncbi:MAG: hypothetical protein GXP31_18665 [Kiritimatiellaeota bacterium]|nr:hypothetical protein [Kiritimatiellota bacterium]